MISFQACHFPKDLILMAAAYPQSYRNIEELMDEGGVDMDHSALQKWVIHFHRSSISPS